MQQWEYWVEILGGTPPHLQAQLGVFKRPLAPGARPYGWHGG